MVEAYPPKSIPRISGQWGEADRAKGITCMSVSQEAGVGYQNPKYQNPKCHNSNFHNPKYENPEAKLESVRLTSTRLFLLNLKDPETLSSDKM